MSFLTSSSSNFRPIRRLVAKKVLAELVTAWRLAGIPTNRSPSGDKRIKNTHNLRILSQSWPFIAGGVSDRRFSAYKSLGDSLVDEKYVEHHLDQLIT